MQYWYYFVIPPRTATFICKWSSIRVLKPRTKYCVCTRRGSESTFPGYSSPADSDDAKSWTQREATKHNRDCCGKEREGHGKYKKKKKKKIDKKNNNGGFGLRCSAVVEWWFSPESEKKKSPETGDGSSPSTERKRKRRKGQKAYIMLKTQSFIDQSFTSASCYASFIHSNVYCFFFFLLLVLHLY